MLTKDDLQAIGKIIKAETGPIKTEQKKQGEKKDTLLSGQTPVKVEDALDGIAMRLENEHWRISSAFAELTPLLVQ